ncbi:MAG: copper chaperone PCu(A)C [Sideroxydans sp.]
MALRNILVAGLLLSAQPTWAGNDVIVDKVWLRESVPGQTAATVQLNLSVTKAARLLEVSSPLAATGEIVRVERRGGKMQSHTLRDYKLEARSTVIFGARGIYLLLRDLKQPLNVGDRVPVSLTLQIAGVRKTVEVTAEVRSLELSYKHYNDPAVMDHR